MVKSRELKAGKIFKHSLLVSLCGLAGFFLLSSLQKPEQEHHIKLKVVGVNNDKGQLRLSVFDQADGFPDNGQKAIKILSVPAKKGTVEVVVDKLPAGEYAIALLHDENENGTLDTNVLGYPKEGYGASNNQLPTFRAPSFSEAVFQVPAAAQGLEIFIRY